MDCRAICGQARSGIFLLLRIGAMKHAAMSNRLSRISGGLPQGLCPLAQLSGEAKRPASGEKAISAAPRPAAYPDDSPIRVHDGKSPHAVSRRGLIVQKFSKSRAISLPRVFHAGGVFLTEFQYNSPAVFYISFLAGQCPVKNPRYFCSLWPGLKSPRRKALRWESFPSRHFCSLK